MSRAGTSHFVGWGNQHKTAQIYLTGGHGQPRSWGRPQAPPDSKRGSPGAGAAAAEVEEEEKTFLHPLKFGALGQSPPLPCPVYCSLYEHEKTKALTMHSKLVNFPHEGKSMDEL